MLPERPGNAWTWMGATPVTVVFWRPHLNGANPYILAQTVIHEMQHVFQAFFPSRDIFLASIRNGVTKEMDDRWQAEAYAVQTRAMQTRDANGVLSYDQCPAS